MEPQYCAVQCAVCKQCVVQCVVFSRGDGSRWSPGNTVCRPVELGAIWPAITEESRLPPVRPTIRSARHTGPGLSLVQRGEVGSLAHCTLNYTLSLLHTTLHTALHTALRGIQSAKKTNSVGPHLFALHRASKG